ncbi:hypothetical protein HMPREF0724_14611 [Prescottella equi ATCC 33707]|uniref:Uncharacterized protein n=1 Tax=Prescottella equi ATCC 33707 TaxID=525370 RepID=E9T755_RHOHA|nr:hypothetical protein HMPREF0724_14611 [Prescottella equi ATCC 33707]
MTCGLLCGSKRSTGTAEPRGGVPVRSDPAAATEKQSAERHAG